MSFQCRRCGVQLVEEVNHTDRDCAENLMAILRDIREQLRDIREQLRLARAELDRRRIEERAGG